MNYIRTKGAIHKILDEYKDHYLVFGGVVSKDRDDFKKAETIEKLIYVNDMLVVGDDKNQMPIFVESIEYLKAWLFCHDIYKIKEFYIKVGNDWHLVAKMNIVGVLELI